MYRGFVSNLPKNVLPSTKERKKKPNVPIFILRVIFTVVTLNEHTLRVRGGDAATREVDYSSIIIIMANAVIALYREITFDRELILGRFFVCFACVREGVRNEAVDSIDAYSEGLSHMKKKSLF